MARFGRVFRHVAVLALLCVTSSASAAGLLTPAVKGLSAEKREQLQADPLVIRWRTAQMDGHLLLRPSAWSAPLDVNLFPDVEMKAHVRSAKSLESGSVLLFGTLAKGGHFTLFRHRSGLLRGNFHSAQGVYSLRSDGQEGQILVAQQDPSVLPACGVTGSSVTRNTATTEEQTQPDNWVYLDVLPKSEGYRDLEPSQSAAQQNRTTEPVDVLVLYTQRVEDHEGGPSQVRATIEFDLEQTNQYLVNSELPHLQMRLAAMVKVDYVQSSENPPPAANSPGYEDYLWGVPWDVQRLRRTSENGLFDHVGYDALDEVFPMIEEHGADLVHLYVRDPVEACGFSTFPYDYYAWATVGDNCEGADNHALCVLNITREHMKLDRFSASSIKCGSRTFAHELGHSMSLNHYRAERLGSMSWSCFLRQSVKVYSTP